MELTAATRFLGLQGAPALAGLTAAEVQRAYRLVSRPNSTDEPLEHAGKLARPPPPAAAAAAATAHLPCTSQPLPLPHACPLQECLAAHPDKGGNVERFQQLTAARDALLAALDAASAVQRQEQQRTERHVLAALGSLARLQEQHAPARGHVLSITSERMQARGTEVDCPVLTISGTAWRKVLVPTGEVRHVLASLGLGTTWAVGCLLCCRARPRLPN